MKFFSFFEVLIIQLQNKEKIFLFLVNNIIYIIFKFCSAKVSINFITDGDIAGVLSVIGDQPKNDIYYSIPKKILTGLKYSIIYIIK